MKRTSPIILQTSPIYYAEHIVCTNVVDFLSHMDSPHPTK
jgi:hypothetical protein